MVRFSTIARVIVALVLPVAWTGQPPEVRAEAVRFDGHQVVRIEVTDEADLQTILNLEEASADFDLWTDGIGIGTVDVRVSPDQRALLDANDLTYTILVHDVQKQVENERSGLPGFFEDYRTYDEHVSFLNQLAVDHPALAQVVSLGTSIEGRDLWALRITGPGTDKPGILSHGCEHAREWLTPPIITYAADYLLENYGTDSTATTLVDNVEWFFMPIMNPDGYVYSWTDYRFWRKNRRDNGNGTFGVDLNRNWGYGWGGTGSSGASSSDIYRGPSRFSEPETQAVRDFILSNERLGAYLDIHTAARMVLWPWGYSFNFPPDQTTFAAVGGVMRNLVYAVHGTYYVAGTVSRTIYPASGVSVDWVYGEADRWAYTVEARGPGFAVPADQIIPAAEENLPAILYLGAWVAACTPFGSTTSDAFPDCNGNGIADICDMADAGIVDCNYNLVPDECEPDEDCNDNGIQDLCDIGSHFSQDCNQNAVPDECDLAAGVSTDCNANAIPDECESADDCNDNGVQDFCDLATGTSEDCNDNAVPDECDPNEDCNHNGVQDICDIATGASIDCNNNEIPDDCDVAMATSADCNGNDVPDECEASGDCNGNGILDICDLATGESKDCNGNNWPDECDLHSTDPSAADDCAAAHLACPGDTYSGISSGATADGEASCGLTESSPDVWYAYWPTDSGTLTVSLCGSAYDTVVSIHTGCPGDATNEIACNDDWCVLQSQVNASVVSGTVYWIRISGFAGDSGSFTLTLTGPDSVLPCGVTSIDCNTNGVPDECEPDCNGSGVPDDCDVTTGTSEDCNFNTIPDECEDDCNGNGLDDSCDIADGTSTDCDVNEIPDECEPDTDSDGVIDACDPCPLDNPDDYDGDGACNSVDECPFDPGKIIAGTCGCGSPDDDEDGDGVPNCIDQCPGVDDNIYAPGCVGAIPTTSGWGIAILALLFLTAAKIYCRPQTRYQSE